MPELFKCTWFLDYGRGGFSFSHFRQSDDYVAAMNEAIDLAQLYTALCGTEVHMKYIRVSRNNIRGDSVVRAVNAISGVAPASTTPPPAGWAVAVRTPPDAWWTAALLRLGASPSVYGRQFVRGIPDEITILPDGLTDNKSWNDALKRYIAKLVSKQWGMYAIPRGPDYQKDITDITSAGAPATWTITTAQNHGIAVNSKFRISGFVGAGVNNVNGVWRATAVPSVTTITISPNQGFAQAGVIDEPGKLWTQGKAFAPYVESQCVLLRVTERRAGRPFDVLAGRRKKRKSS